MKAKVAILLAALGLIMVASPAQAGVPVAPPPPAVPTPALLPGLIGLGLGVFQKCSNDKSNSDS